MIGARKAKLWQSNIWKVCCCVILSMTAGLFLGTGLSVSAAEGTGDDVVVLDVSKRIDIYADGYKYANGNKVSHTGRYILTGTGRDEVNFLGENTSYDVTVRNLTIKSPSKQSAIKIANGVTLNLQVEGINSVKAGNHPGIQLNVAETDHANLNITLKRNSSLSLDAAKNPIKSFADNITVNVDDKNGDIQGTDKLNNKTEALNLTKGTPKKHDSYIKKSINDTYHQEICPDCDARGITSKHNLTDIENGKTCEECEYSNTLVVLDVGKGKIDIYADGYIYAGSNKISYTGRYMLIGSGSSEVNFLGKNTSYDVTMRNLTMESPSISGQSAIKVSDGVTLNLQVEGTNSVIASNHPGIQLNVAETEKAAVNIILKKDSSLRLDATYNSLKSFADNITVKVDDKDGDIQGIDKLNNKTETLNLIKGTPKAHEYKWVAFDDSQHQEVCSDCDSKGIKTGNHVWEDVKTEAGHGRRCTECGYEDMNAHTYGDMTHTDAEHSRTCTECGYEDKKAHTYGDMMHTDEEHSRICTECGYEDKNAHTYGDMTYTDTEHSHTCTTCNYVKTNPHNFITAESGQVCKDCGYKKANTTPKEDDKKDPDTDKKEDDKKDLGTDKKEDGKKDTSTDKKEDGKKNTTTGKKDNNKKNPNTNTAKKIAPAKGTSLTDKKSGVTYVVTVAGKEISYRKPNSKKKSVVIPAKITINGYTYKVTSIADNAFRNNKKVTSVTIGKNIKRIGKKAFFGCKNLKKITVKTTLLKAKTVGNKAFTKAGSKNYKKLKVKMPKKKAKVYLKIFRKKGLKK